MFESSFWTEGDLRTSARAWTCPEEECTTTREFRRGFRDWVVVFARDWMCFWKPAAVKPGEARRMGFEERSVAFVAGEEGLNSSWRRRVSRVVWKNLVRTCYKLLC